MSTSNSPSSIASASFSMDSNSRNGRSRSRSTRPTSPHSSARYSHHDSSSPSSSSNPNIGIGLSCMAVASGDELTHFKFVSESMREILGYAPEELVGKSAWLIFHPEEVPYLREIHYHSLMNQRCACVAYMSLLHRDGHFVEVCVSYSFVYGETILTYCRAEDGPNTIQQALTARDVFEVSPGSQGKWGVRRWTQSASSSGFNTPSSTPFQPLAEPLPLGTWQLGPPHPRTFFFIDRFTDTARVIFTSNDVIANTSKLRDRPFYSIVRPSDRTLVKQYIDTAKSWSPIIQNERRSGGHGYCKFSLLKILDLPAHGEVYPQGTDEGERMMPGQEFIPVEGIFSACSDGLLCIVSKVIPGTSF